MTSDRDELELGAGERLPWLETAEDYDERRRRGWGTVVAVLLGVVALALVIGGIWYTQRGHTVVDDGELIAAPEGDYKTRADGSDGMKVGNESDAMLAASEGQEASGRIANADAAQTASAGSETTTERPSDPATPAAPSVRPASTSGAAVQLGAFADEASAEVQWTKLSRAQAPLAKLNHSVERVAAGGKTVFRLRASAADATAARSLCGQLQKANVACFAVR